MTEIKVRRNCPAEFVGRSGGGRLEGEVIRAMKEIDQKSDVQMGSWRYLWEIEKENDLSRQEFNPVSFSAILMRSFLGKNHK